MPAAAADAVHPAQPAQEENGTGRAIQIARSVAMFVAMQMAMKYGMSYFGMGPKNDAPAVPNEIPVADGGAAVTEGAAAATAASAVGKAAFPASPAWEAGTPMSMYLYVNTAPSPAGIDVQNPNVIWDGLTFGDWKDVREEDLIIDVPETVRAENGSLFMDILLVKDGGSPIGREPGVVANHRKELTRWMPERRVRAEKSLLGKATEEEHTEEEEEHEEDTGVEKRIVSYWSRNLTIAVVSDGGQIDWNAINPALRPYYQVGPKSVDNKNTYFPPIFPNDFWLLKENMVPINQTTPQLPLHVTYNALSGMKFQIFATLTVSFEQASQQQGSGAELDAVKRMLTETNPVLLITTLIVSVLHMLFEFLAFSSDVSHWRKKKENGDLVGVSLNTILTNCFVQLVILLYLHESSEETSWMILFSQGMGLVIEAWKITKVVNVRVRENPGSLIGYKVTFEDKHELTEDELKTQEYDALAFRIVSMVALPCLLAYAGYSLMYNTHRSWYSFVITTLAQAVYMGGFAQLIPQLIINHKLKSVAHMPMKAMVYKTLSTVVDDFFAFIIPQPWLHRLACFRDDAVFVVLLYQRWIYRIDYSRVNEYGQVADEAEVEDEKEGAKKGDKVESKKDK